MREACFVQAGSFMRFIRVTWEKSKGILKLPPQEGYDRRNWRDPFVLWDENKGEYLLILGARKGEDKRKQTGRLVKFTSRDLEEWSFEGDNDKNSYLWGGTFVPHELYQREDGTLGAKPVDSLWNAFKEWENFSGFCVKTIYTKTEKIIIEDTGDLMAFETTIRFAEGTRAFSLKFYEDPESGTAYEYRFLIEENRVVFDKSPNYPWYQCFNIGLERPILLEAEKEYKIRLIVDDTIGTLYINGTALNARFYDKPGTALGMTVTDGTFYCKDTKISKKVKKER